MDVEIYKAAHEWLSLSICRVIPHSLDQYASLDDDGGGGGQLHIFILSTFYDATSEFRSPSSRLPACLTVCLSSCCGNTFWWWEDI